MSDFIKLFENETVGTIEALVGVAPSMELKRGTRTKYYIKYCTPYSPCKNEVTR